MINCKHCGHSIDEHAKIGCKHHDVINPATWAPCTCGTSANDIAEDNKAALVEAARAVNQAYAKSSEFKMLDGSPCWCVRTDRHTVHCEIKRAQYGNLAALLDAARK